MQFIAQFRETLDVAQSDYPFHLKRARRVIDVLAARDDRLSEWFLTGDTKEEARLYPVYEADGSPTSAAIAVLKEEYREEGHLAKSIAMWNGREQRKDGATLSLAFDNSPLAHDFDLSLGEEGPDASRLGDFESVAQVVAAIADAYAPAYVTAAPRKYSPRQVFDDKPGVGWMIYLPQKITIQQVPEARALIPVKGEDGKQIGTIIVSVTDAVFSVDNPQHVEVANRIEIRLVDQDLLPAYADI